MHNSELDNVFSPWMICLGKQYRPTQYRTWHALDSHSYICFHVFAQYRDKHMKFVHELNMFVQAWWISPPGTNGQRLRQYSFVTLSAVSWQQTSRSRFTLLAIPYDLLKELTVFLNLTTIPVSVYVWLFYILQYLIIPCGQIFIFEYNLHHVTTDRKLNSYSCSN